MPKSLHANIRKMLVFRASWLFLVMIPVLVPYQQSLGFSMQQVFWLQIIFAVMVSILEVPSGYLCDLWGRKNTLIAGSFVSAIGFTWLWFARSFIDFALFELAVGVGMSLVSGADLAMVYDSISTEQQREFGRKIMGEFTFYSQVSEALAALLGGILAIQSFEWVIGVQVLAAWVPVFASLTLIEPSYEKMDRQYHGENFKRIMNYLFRSDRLVKLIFINFLIWNLSTFMPVWIFQKNWMVDEIPLGMFGAIWAAYQFTGGWAGRLAATWEARKGAASVLHLLVGFCLLGYIGQTFFDGWWAVALGLCFYLTRGFTQTLFHNALNFKLPSEFRATANSLVSLGFRSGFCLLGPLAGYSLDHWGINITFAWIGLIFLVLFLAVGRPLALAFRSISTSQ